MSKSNPPYPEAFRPSRGGAAAGRVGGPSTSRPETHSDVAVQPDRPQRQPLGYGISGLPGASGGTEGPPVGPLKPAAKPFR
jgi:hypothetical protein